jgi:hypothetical protein
MWDLVQAIQYVDDKGFCRFRNTYRCDQSGTMRAEDIPDAWCEGNCTPTTTTQQQQQKAEEDAEDRDKKKNQEEDNEELLLTEAKLSSMMNTILTDKDYDKEKQERMHRIQVWLEQQQVLN